MVTYKGNNVFMSGTIPPILQPMDQGVVLTLKSYYLRNTFYKAIIPQMDDFEGFKT